MVPLWELFFVLHFIFQLFEVDMKQILQVDQIKLLGVKIVVTVFFKYSMGLLECFMFSDPLLYLNHSLEVALCPTKHPLIYEYEHVEPTLKIIPKGKFLPQEIVDTGKDMIDLF